MATNSAISWTTHTFNPWMGCTKVSPACDGCYAEALMDLRYGKVEWGPGADRVRTSVANWRLPLRWNKAAEADGSRPFVFCASLADVFDNEVDEIWRRDLFALIEATPRLVWLLLTKRVGNVLKMTDVERGHRIRFDNIAIGATMANQEEYDRDRRKLHDVKHARGPLFAFGSFEPLLGQIILDELAPDWIITGGETDQGAHKARPTHPDWVRSMRDQCAARGIPFHHKQWGEFREFDTGSPAVEEIDNGSETADAMVAAAIHPSWITLDGLHITRRDKLPDDETPCRLIERVGKHRAGRLLDGVEHNAMPEVR